MRLAPGFSRGGAAFVGLSGCDVSGTKPSPLAKTANPRTTQLYDR
jgi:hypothetical protein